MRVLRIDERLAAAEFPQVLAGTGISVCSGDARIVCAGFEDRSLAVLRALPAGAECIILLVEYRPSLLGNRLEECLFECGRSSIFL